MNFVEAANAHGVVIGSACQEEIIQLKVAFMPVQEKCAAKSAVFLHIFLSQHRKFLYQIVLHMASVGVKDAGL